LLVYKFEVNVVSDSHMILTSLLANLEMQCMPGDPQKVLVTSNDSRVRVYDGLNLVAKYKGISLLPHSVLIPGF